MKNVMHLMLLIVLGVMLSACGVDINRNDDGSLTVEATMLEDDLQREIRAAIADPLIQELAVEFQDGYVDVIGERKRLKSEEIDTIRFRLNLGVGDGHLTAIISEARLNNTSIDGERVGLWNERIANRLARSGNRNPNSKLQTVVVGNDSVTMVWRVETPRSRGN